jgi:glyoxylase-like metal-dependent hydrolase (beta-lactamase superfamily II)
MKHRGHSNDYGHLIYSHVHKDHVGAAYIIFQQQPEIEIVAQKETADILKMRNDPQRPHPFQLQHL